MDIICEMRKAVGRREAPRPATESAEGSLRIDCRACARAPEARSNECIRCVVKAISGSGAAGKVVLRSRRDIEISGAALDILCDIAALDASAGSMPGQGSSRACSRCEYSRRRIFDMAWVGLPDPYFDEARSRLSGFSPRSEECAACARRTAWALDHAESGLDRIKKRAAGIASGGQG
ncbi:MAG: hypothetical protein LBG62_07355 [Candidatus Methanoplasma sp.]|jgi:hypothetical protein|nr:hypothetical protein [Candidatus Methanoplasma sp.]